MEPVIHQTQGLILLFGHVCDLTIKTLAWVILIHFTLISSTNWTCCCDVTGNDTTKPIYFFSTKQSMTWSNSNISPQLFGIMIFTTIIMIVKLTKHIKIKVISYLLILVVSYLVSSYLVKFVIFFQYVNQWQLLLSVNTNIGNNKCHNYTLIMKNDIILLNKIRSECWSKDIKWILN